MKQDNDINAEKKILHSIRSEMSYIGTYLYQSKKYLNEAEVVKMHDVAVKSYDNIRSLINELSAIFRKNGQTP
ncbi:MAG: hypothetical protein HQM16_13615 [Deltaproteobacteria bacterium]|nr:hypothetical protein [Deltaproteobacteria bacterium]